MAIKTWNRHVRSSMQTIWRNGWMSLASIGAVTVTLLLVGVFVAIMMNLNKIASDFENDVEIKVLIDTDVKEKDVFVIQRTIKKMPEVDEVRYASKEDELKKVVDDFGEDLSLFDQENPLHNVLYVKASEPEKTAELAKAIDGMAGTYDVVYGKGKIDKLFHFVDTARTVGVIFIVALVLIAIFLIFNTIKLTIAARRNEIEIMKLVGATNSYVRVPFMLEGMWLGILGAIMPIIVVAITYVKVFDWVAPLVKNEAFSFIAPSQLLMTLSISMLLMGIIIGVFGSAMSVRKYLALK
jgi:cell division transport system permease protein